MIKCLCHFRSFVETFKNIIHELEVDDTAVLVLIYICPIRELVALFNEVKPYLAVAGLAKKVKETMDRPPGRCVSSIFYYSECNM